VARIVSVCAALLLVAAGNHLVAPLYPLYQTRFALSTTAVTVVASTFAVALIPAMLAAGPLSDRWGRGPLLAAGLGAFALGDLTFAAATGPGWLIAARLLHGLGMGAFFSPATALASDVAGRHRDHAALGSAVAAMVGFGLGPLAVGLAVHRGWAPARAPFLVHVALLIVAAALVRRALATAAPSAGPPTGDGGRDRPRVRRLAGVASFAGWSIGGLLLTLLPAILRPVLGTAWSVVGGSALFLLMLAGAAGQIVTYRWPPQRALVWGCLAEALGFALLVAALRGRWVWLILGAALLTGVGLAAVHRGGIGVVLAATPAARKGRAVSLFLASGYFGGSFLVMAFAAVADARGMEPALLGYSVGFGAVLVVVAARLVTRGDDRATHGGAPPHASPGS
jgi:predicted MFS family arabinose efflux permease